MAGRKQQFAAVTDLTGVMERHTLEFEGLTVNLEVAPRRFNSALERDMQEVGTSSEGVVLMVSRLVVGWDLMESHEPGAKPCPLTPEALAELPMVFLAAVAEKLSEVLGPKPMSTTVSAGTS